jgi:hypothetical protein
VLILSAEISVSALASKRPPASRMAVLGPLG